MYLDISTIKDQKGKTKPRDLIEALRSWNLMKSISATFFHRKGMVKPTCIMLNKWKTNGKAVTHVR